MSPQGVAHHKLRWKRKVTGSVNLLIRCSDCECFVNACEYHHEWSKEHGAYNDLREQLKGYCVSMGCGYMLAWIIHRELERRKEGKRPYPAGHIVTNGRQPGHVQDLSAAR